MVRCSDIHSDTGLRELTMSSKQGAEKEVHLKKNGDSQVLLEWAV
jgi:hypothetical protein